MKRLKDGGYRCVEASSGAEGIRLARSLIPLAITLDLRMPVTDGLEVLRALSADARTRDIPVVLITVTERNHIAVPADGVHYVQKPFTKEDLLTAIASVMHPLPACDVMVIDDDPTALELISTVSDCTMNGQCCNMDCNVTGSNPVMPCPPGATSGCTCFTPIF